MLYYATNVDSGHILCVNVLCLGTLLKINCLQWICDWFIIFIIHITINRVQSVAVRMIANAESSFAVKQLKEFHSDVV